MYCIQENNYKATAVFVIMTYFAQNNSNNNNNNDDNNNNNNNSNDSNNDNNNDIIIILGWCPGNNRKYWLDVQWGIVSSHGERDPL